MEGKLLAEEKIVTGKFVVSFSAEAGQKTWIVNALEQNIYNDLSGYARVVPFRKDTEKEKTCKNRNVNCILDIYKKLNVDAIMLGVVDDSDIDYEIYDIQNKSLIKTGSIKSGRGSNLLKLRMGAFKAFKPFIEKGGILDKRKYITTASDDPDEANDQPVQDNSNRDLKNQVLISLAVFTCIPYLLTFIGKPLRHPERTKIVLRWFYPFQVFCLSIIGYQYVLESSGSGSIFNNILHLFDDYQWVLTGLGGMIWGYFIILNFKIVVPHLQGIERIRPKNLFQLFKSCLLTIIIKALFIVTFYSAFFYGVYFVGTLFSINQQSIILLLLPISGLYISYWIALLLDVFSMSIDVKLAGRSVDYNNVWNTQIRKYFISNLKRNGVTLNKRLVEDIVFLPGENKGIVCYGGGFSRPRMTIEKDLIKFALGDVDEFNPAETIIFKQKIVDPVLRQNSAFRIIANLSPQSMTKKLFKSRHDKKRTKYLDGMRKYIDRDLDYQGTHQNYRIDDVMQGIVLPNLEGDVDLPPLMSDNLDDMQVLEELLLEFSKGKDRYDDDAEIDDSNDGDKDFLFGAILQKFGGLLRHEDIFSTFYLYFRGKNKAKKGPYNFLFSKYFAIVADTFVVLNFGLNNLLQHLYYQATDDSSHLTTKGMSSSMLKSQDEILTSAKKVTDERKPKIIQTDQFDRLVWLSRFSQDSKENQDLAYVGERIFIKWSFFLVATYLVAVVLVDSYNYHPKYLDIIQQEKQEIAEAIKNAQEEERNEND